MEGWVSGWICGWIGERVIGRMGRWVSEWKVKEYSPVSLCRVTLEEYRDKKMLETDVPLE
jgi:hypothetical protein